MEFKSYRISLIFRLILIIANCFGILYAFKQPQWYVTRFGLILILVYQTYSLLKYHESWIRKLNYLLELIQVNEFSYRFDRKENQDNDLEKKLDKIVDHFSSLRIDKEAHYQYLLTVLEHNQTPTLCFDSSGKIHLSNKAVRELFGNISIIHINQLDKHYTGLATLLNAANTKDKKFFKLKHESGLSDYSISLTDFHLQDTHYRLCSFYNISFELENKELESYQRLSRVMTHEVMNSLTPVSTLSNALKKMMDAYQPEDPIDEEDLEDLNHGLSTIEKRSISLSTLIKDYKKIHQLPPLRMEELVVNEILHHLLILMKDELKNRGINLVSDISLQNEKILGDHDQLMQVLINLVTNAIQALDNTETPSICIGGKMAKGKINIWVSDNGCGMDQDTLENVFIPFFTTKKQGSGIGLSLSRRIIMKHQGQISVSSQPGKGSTFRIVL